MSKKALYIGVHSWDSPFQVGSHAIVKELIREGWEVAYISAPVSPMHLFHGFSEELKVRWNNFKKGGQNKYNGALWYYTPFAIVTPTMRPILSSKWLIMNWHLVSIPNIITKVKKRGFGDIDLLFIDSLFQPFWLDSITYKSSVLRLSDNYSGFQGYNNSIQSIERKLISRVDHVVVPAKNLKKHVYSMNPKHVIHIPNGIDNNHFSRKKTKLPNQFLHIPEPRIIYVGAIQEWFDFKLVKKMATILNDVSIVLIGPVKHIPKDFHNIENIYIQGIQPHNIIPTLLQYAQVGIIPFDVQNHPLLVNNIHPLKLYEYLACGIPVVSTDWKELRLMNSPAILCKHTDDFIHAVQEQISKPVNLQELTLFTQKAEWRHRVKKLLDFL